MRCITQVEARRRGREVSQVLGQYLKALSVGVRRSSARAPCCAEAPVVVGPVKFNLTFVRDALAATAMGEESCGANYSLICEAICRTPPLW